MIRIPLLLLLFAAPVLADLEYAAVPGAVVLPEGQRKQAFRIDVEDGGRLLLEDRQWITLAHLAKLLTDARAEYERTNPSPDPRLSQLPVVIHVDRRAPWFHVQLVLLEAAAAGCPEIWFAVAPDGKRVVSARLPMAQSRTRVGMMSEIECLVTLEPTNSAVRAWSDGSSVKQPTAVAYRLRGSDEAVERDLAGALLAAITAEQGKSVVCRAVLSPPPPTPFGLVAGAMTVFDGGRFRSIEFATPAAVDVDRKERQLPFPSRQVADPPDRGTIGDRVVYEAIPPRTREFPGGPIDAGVRPPLAPGGVPDRMVVRDGRVLVNLTGSGLIRVGETEFSLSAFLRHLALDVHPDQRKPPPRVLLRVDGHAPWQHAMHVLGALSRFGVENVEFATRLRADAGDSARDALVFGVPRVEEAPDPERNAAMVQLSLRRATGELELADVLETAKNVWRDQLEIRAEREIDSTFGPNHEKVRRPLNVRITWNGRSTYAFSDFIAWIQLQRAEQLRRRGLWDNKRMRVVVAVGEKVPSRYAIAALARLQALGWREIYFFERLPQESPRLLESIGLPYPRTNELIRGNDGLGDAPLPDSSVPSLPKR